MKKIYKQLIAAAMLLMAGNAFASGGPDAYGYTWMTSADAGGPTYNWVDITTKPGVQTVTGLADDNSTASMINIGFNFHYYWSDYSQMKVGSNGWVAFNNVSNIASCFPTIPTAGGAADNYLALLMSDLNFTGAGNPGSVKYWSNSVDTFIISYLNVPYWSVNSPGWTGANSFQVILCKSDSSITYQYGSLSTLPANAACVDMTVGIENSTGAIGLQVFSDAAPSSSFAIKFDYPAVVLLSIQDPVTRWNANSANKAEFIPNNTPYTVMSNFMNNGNTAVTTSISLQADILNSASANVYTSSGSVPTLSAGDDTTFIFSPAWTPTAAGQYSFSATLTNSQDVNAANNINTTELEVVDVCASSMILNYATTGTPNGSLNWNGGANDDGAAVYFKPPVYPYTISQLEYYITSNVGDGFIAQLYADNGANGGPGTLLFTQNVAAGSVLTNAWNTVTVSTPVTLSSGGFYVVWLQGGTTIFLGTESNGPLSHQNYEILDGGWASYRNNDTRDIYIRATINNFSGTPVASYTSSQNLLNAAFTNTSYGPGATYSWDFGDANTSTLTNPSHTYAAAGTYTVCLTVTNTCGNNQSCQSVVVCNQPVAAYAPAAAALAVNFTDMSTGTVDSWAWDFGDGNTSTQQNPAHTYATAGTYTVCLVTSNSCGYADTICQSIMVCAAPVAAFSTSDALTSITLTDMSTGTVDAWAWDFGDGNTSTSQNPSNTYSAAGTYNVCLTISNACGDQDNICQQVTVCDALVAGFTLSSNNDTVFVNDATSGAATTWMWDFGDGNTSSQQNDNHVYAGGGTYTVCLTTTDACGNSDSSCQQVTILITSVSDISAVGFNAYPNPVIDMISLDMTNLVQDAKVDILDVSGKQVAHYTALSGKQVTLDVSSLSPGMYFIRLNDTKGAHTTYFVKQ